MKHKLITRIVLICLLSQVGLSVAHAQRFTIPVLPDTQVEVDARPEMLYSQLRWIATNKKASKIPIVLHVGDVVNYDNWEHWERASKIFKVLDSAKVPYALALGNHDTEAVGVHNGGAAPGNVNANLRKTTKFNTCFPVKRFSAQVGRYEPNKSDNSFYTFKAGGLNWLVVTLEFCARQGPVDWANTVIDKYPKHNVIILTHYHLTPKGEINQTNAGYGDLTSQAIYDQMIKKHHNILFVLSGHVVTSAHRTDVGDKGNTIYQLLQNYQSLDYGGGYIRLLEIDPKAGTLSASMYSPFYNITKNDESKFSISGIKFIK
jgi:hypothetical protein